MSLNLCLTDSTDKTEFRLRQTPTDLTKACLKLGRREDVVAQYESWLISHFRFDPEGKQEAYKHTAALRLWLKDHPCAKFGSV